MISAVEHLTTLVAGNGADDDEEDNVVLGMQSLMTDSFKSDCPSAENAIMKSQTKKKSKRKKRRRSKN